MVVRMTRWCRVGVWEILPEYSSTAWPSEILPALVGNWVGSALLYISDTALL